MSTRQPARSRVHVAGNARLDAVLDFVAFAARPRPLGALLDEAPRRIALMLPSDVCSLYLVEGSEGELVMRGNVGFANAIGEVRLSVGEGITGEAVEYMRPVSSVAAPRHDRYKHFEALGEERFPVFLAVPIRGKSGPLGALAVQRREGPFDDRDVELLSVLGAVVAAGVRQAELIDEVRERRARRAGGGTRKVTLTGRPVVVGRALGAIAALRRPSARPSERASDRAHDPELEVRLLKAAFDVAGKAIRGLASRATAIGIDGETAFFSTYLEILEDARLRERATGLVQDGIGIAAALSHVARDVARSAVSFTRDAYLEERAKDVEDLCDALTALADGDRRSALPSKALLVGDTLTVFDLLVSARSSPAGIALEGRATGPRLRALLKLLNIPAVAEVGGLFRWASDGDVALLDGDHGLLIINPSKGEMASLREKRRGTG